jgi:O-antigen ligase
MMMVWLIPFAGILASAGIALALRWPMVAVCLFLAITLSNTPAILVHEHGLPSIGTLLVPALAALLLLRSIMGLDRPAMALALAPFLGVLLLATVFRIPWEPDTDTAAFIASELAKNLVIVLVLVGFLTTTDRIVWATRAVTATIGAIAALSVLQYATGRFDLNFLGYANAAYLHIEGPLQGWRLTGPLPDPNFYAQLLVMFLPLPFALAFIERSWSMRLLALLAGSGIIVAIALTYSRGALLGVAVVALAALLMSRNRALLLPGLVIGIMVVVLAGPDAAVDRALSGIETGRLLLGDANIAGDPAVIQRVSVMRAALRMFVENPLFGVGPGHFSHAYADYSLRFGLDMAAPPAAHSLYLEIAAEQGVLGLSLFAALILTALGLAGRSLWRMQRAGGLLRETVLLRAMALGLLGYLATAAFLHDAFPRFFWVLMALLIATWAASAAALSKRTSHSGSSEMREHSQATTDTEKTGPFAEAKTLALQAVTTRKFPILLAAVLLGGLTAFQTMQAPTQYTSDAKLIYRFGREYFPVTPTEVRRNWGENIIVSLDNALATELHLLASHDVAKRTLEQLNMPLLKLGSGRSAVGMTEAERVEAFAKLLDVRRIQGATMLGVRITYTDPRMVDRMLETFIEAYLDRRDALFHADAESYFAGQLEALKAKDEAAQSELMRLRFERSEVEAQANLTDWSPDQPVAQPDVDMAQITRQLAWIDGLIDQQEKRSEVFRTRLVELESEKQDWEMSRAYSQQVMPPVEIADRTPVVAVPDTTQAVARVISSAVMGAVLAWAAAFALLWMQRNKGGAGKRRST